MWYEKCKILHLKIKYFLYYFCVLDIINASRCKEFSKVFAVYYWELKKNDSNDFDVK